MNFQASAGTDAGLIMPPVAELAPEADTATTLGDNESDWLCAWCHNRVASEKDRFPYNGKDQFTFSNPEGIRFAIITFSRTLGCRGAGQPTLEDTWFPGHAWCYCLCDSCGQHLGWCYVGQYDFAGLIAARIVRAVCVRN